MKLKVLRDGELWWQRAEVEDYTAIPNMVFALAQYGGSGEYIAQTEDGEDIFRLVSEWLEPDEPIQDDRDDIASYRGPDGVLGNDFRD